MAEEPVLRTIHLGKRYRNRWAVRDLNLQVMRGEVFGFLGPNGAGKSTTIRMLLSLLTPTTGHVELFGKSLLRHRREVLSRVGGLVERADFYLYLSARRNLEIVAALADCRDGRAISRALETVGLTERANDKVKTFSHGMKQRLGLAQALLGSPEFIILDEPTSGLDPQGIKEVRELILRLSSERSMTILLSSHLLSEIEQTATSMAILNAGALVVQGRVAALLAEGPTTVRIDARPAERARMILDRMPSVSGIKENDGMIECNIHPEQIGAVNQMLVESGVAVHALIPRRSLEEYFLSITEGSSEVASPQMHKRK